MTDNRSEHGAAAELGRLREEVDDLRRRVAALEQSAADALGSAGSAWSTVPVSPEGAPMGSVLRADSAWLTLIGRTFMVFGGAYLLRALTESQTVSMGAGVWLGLTYASIWLAFASRATKLSSTLHGASALFIGVPLIVEASARFGYFNAATGAITLSLISIAGLAVGWGRRNRTITALAAGTTSVAGFVLAIAFETFSVFAPVILLISLFSLWIGYERNWRWLYWGTAFAANTAVLLLLFRTLATPPRESLPISQLIHGVLAAAYIGTFIIRTLLHERPVRFFEMAQTAMVLTIGVAGAVAISGAGGLGVEAIALGALVAGAMAYVQTFARIAPRFGLGAEFYYFGSTGLALALVGLSLSLSFPARPIVVALGALLTIAVGWRWGHPMLTLQGGIAAIVASLQSGLVAFSARAWLTGDPAWPSDLSPMMLVLVTVGAALVIPRAVRDAASASLAAIARVALAAALIAGLASLLVTVMAPIVAGRPADAGVLATMRTTILCLATVLLARIGKSARFVEMRWLAYAGLAAGGLKIVVEDLPTSRPATLFIALAVYGATLIVLPRIARRGAATPDV